MEIKIPTIYEDMEDMKDLVSFVTKIEASGADKWGVVKVVPPADWSAQPNDHNYDGMNDFIIPKESILTQSFEKANNEGSYYVCAEKIAEVDTDVAGWRMMRENGANEVLTTEVYWNKIGELNPVYGADVPGSLFDPEISQWNLSCLRSILLLAYGRGVAVEGVINPTLFFGSCGSTFALHTEDMDLYSINYHHWGAPKTWYGLPPSLASCD